MRNYGITFSSGDLSFAKFHYGLEVFWGIILGDQDLDYGYYHLGIILQFFAHFSFKHLNLFFFNAISNFVPWESSPWNHHFFLYVWKILFPTPLSENVGGKLPRLGSPPWEAGERRFFMKRVMLSEDWRPGAYPNGSRRRRSSVFGETIMARNNLPKVGDIWQLIMVVSTSQLKDLNGGNFLVPLGGTWRIIPGI